jgi:hypothetical protein
MKNASEQKVKLQQTEGRIFVTYGGTASSRPHSGASVLNEGIRSLRHYTYRSLKKATDSSDAGKSIHRHSTTIQAGYTYCIAVHLKSINERENRSFNMAYFSVRSLWAE